ncbi:MAG: FtsH protease activity modulator HflK [Nitrospinota bacterium]
MKLDDMMKKGGNGGYRNGPQFNLPFKLPDFKGNKGLVIGLIGVLVLFSILSSAFYSIDTEEVGVIQRFGKYVKTTQPGLHMKLPLGIERLTRVKGFQYIFTEEFGFRTVTPGVRSRFAQQGFISESLMLTGDLNSSVVEWAVQYKIKNPENYLFNVRDVTGTIRDISEAVMREVVGDRSVDEVLTIGRREIGTEVEKKMQEILDSYNTGINVDIVKLQGVNPPDPVKPSFNEVNEAKQEKEKMINQAWETYNKAIPEAKGEAERTIRKAEGYALDRINRAKGEANSFISVWEAYKKSKDVTKKRLYLETMREILPGLNRKYIIDSDQKGLLQLLNLSGEEKEGIR